MTPNPDQDPLTLEEHWLRQGPYFPRHFLRGHRPVATVVKRAQHGFTSSAEATVLPSHVAQSSDRIT